MGLDELFEQIPGQERLARELQLHLASPKNSYFFIGSHDAGSLDAAKAFAAALLCENDGCGECQICIAVKRGFHPDVSVFERSGAALTVEEAQEITGIAIRSTSGSKYRIIIVPEMELVGRAAPVLLKSVEEPPLSTIFILLASMELPELKTLLSRSVVVRFDSLSQEQIYEQLIKRGYAQDDSAEAVRLSAGRWSRALELASDRELRQVFSLWEQLPSLLTRDMSTIVSLAEKLVAVGSLTEERKKRSQKEELDELDAMYRAQGARVSASRDRLEERHKRELRKIRTTELRAGLLILERHYRNQLMNWNCGEGEAQFCIDAISQIEQSQAALARNCNEFLLLMALLSRLASKSS